MNWTSRPLAEVVDFHLGKMLDQKKNTGEMLPYLANVNVRWGQFALGNLREMRFEPRELERYGLKYGDIVMCEGGEPGRCAIWKEQMPGMMYQKALHRIRPSSCLDHRFLYFNLRKQGQNGELAGLFTGSTIKHLPREKLASVLVPIPPLVEQRRIADILSTYDELIENNRRRIALLEEAARLLYREWFVHFRFPGHEHLKIVGGLPEGWEVYKLGDLLTKIKRPGKVKKDEYLEEGSIPCVDQSQSFIGGYTEDEEAKITHPLPLVVFGDHTRALKFIDFPFACGADGTQLLYPKDDRLSIQYFYFAVGNVDLSNYFYARHFKFLKDQHLLVPTANLMAEFTDFAKDNLKQISALRKANHTLTRARDLLLPRLVNGEMAV